jgi:ribosomal protein S18 acetylase RimI-like enzyme
MTSVGAVDQVFEAVQRAKADAPAFCTNFFPIQSKLQAWVRNGELLLETRGRSVFFLRRDRDFLRLYFSSASEDALQADLNGWSTIRDEPLVLDVLGNTVALDAWLRRLGPAGFRQYTRLQRMARPVQTVPSAPVEEESKADFASAGEGQAVLALLEELFDHYADQLPMLSELESAIENRQVLRVSCDGQLAAVLFFETQGLTSSIRFWAVAEGFQSRGLGAALIRRYFSLHASVRRFTLWVTSDNQNAIQKYRHYGYSADGLADLVLANERILWS